MGNAKNSVVDMDIDVLGIVDNEVIQTEEHETCEERSPRQLTTNSNPYRGMEFDSIDEAYQFYNNYAKRKGFGVRKNRVYQSRVDKTLIAREFVCWKEGERSKKHKEREDRVHAPHDETRVGCKAKILVSKKEEVKWVISRFIEEHNHILTSPKSTQFIPSHRKKTTVQKNLIDVLDASGIRPSKIMSVLATEAGGIDNVGITQKDVFNYLSSKRQKHLEKGDAQLMYDYFHNCQLKNPGFFYAIQTDADGCLANCFWVDARSRMAYKYFGDVVAFDPTYLTNKYKLPFVPFAGVNNHFQSVLFGCALLWDETEETFVWLLKTWLDAMHGCPPSTIITDQDTAMTNAIARLLPNATHHFCMWHIEKKFPENLSHIYHQNKEFKEEFNKCIHQSVTPNEFDLSWEEILDKYDLHGNQWLQKVYSIREKWVPAFIRKSFCAGMSTTQRSESLNKFFKDYVNSSTLVSKFVTQFDLALDGRYNKEREKNFKSIHSKPVLITMYPLEKEASQVYTRKIFKMFQEELLHSQRYIADKLEFDGEIKVYRVHKQNKEKPFYTVCFGILSSNVTCSCHKFEFMGILCRHALAILIKKKVLSLPKQYILDRWTIHARKNEVQSAFSEVYHDNAYSSSTLWFNSIMVHSLALSDKASRSQKHFDHTIRRLDKLCEELDEIPFEMTKNDGIELVPCINEDATIGAIETNGDDQIIVLKDPIHVVTKGRPRSLRMKGGIENKQKRMSTCSICKQSRHNKSTCKQLR